MKPPTDLRRAPGLTAPVPARSVPAAPVAPVFSYGRPTALPIVRPSPSTPPALQALTQQIDRRFGRGAAIPCVKKQTDAELRRHVLDAVARSFSRESAMLTLREHLGLTVRSALELTELLIQVGTPSRESSRILDHLASSRPIFTSGTGRPDPWPRLTEELAAAREAMRGTEPANRALLEGFASVVATLIAALPLPLSQAPPRVAPAPRSPPLDPAQAELLSKLHRALATGALAPSHFVRLEPQLLAEGWRSVTAALATHRSDPDNDRLVEALRVADPRTAFAPAPSGRPHP